MNTTPVLHQLPHLVAALLVVLHVSGASVVGDQRPDVDVIPGEWIISFVEHASRSIDQGGLGYALDGAGFLVAPEEVVGRVEAIEPLERANAMRPGAVGKYRPLLPNVHLVSVDPQNERATIAQLAARADIDFIEPVRIRRATSAWGSAAPNDPMLPLQWYMTTINAPVAWALSSPAISSVRVAVMDVGLVDPAHVDLAANRDVAGDRDTRPIDSHATRVAGVVGATGNNGVGIAGVANVHLVSFDPGGRNTAFANAIAQAVNDGVDVINMSFVFCGAPNCIPPDDYAPFSQVEQNAISNAAGQIVFVGSAGNDGQSADAQGDLPYPVAYADVIGVSATNQSSQLAAFSNFGGYVDLAAPGVGIISTGPGNQYPTSNGTSFSAPMVAGAAASVFARNPSLNGFDVRGYLLNTASDLGPPGYDTSFGFGLLDVGAAVLAAPPAADVYVDFAHSGSEDGSLAQPYNTLGEALAATLAGQTIAIHGGVSTETFTNPIDQHVNIVAWDGNVTIGE